MRRWEDKKMIDRPPLLEEPFAQTLAGINLFFGVLLGSVDFVLVVDPFSLKGS